MDKERKERVVVGGIIVALAVTFYAIIGKYMIGSIVVVTQPISGVVVDKETGKPIEGVYVGCWWSGSMATLGGPVTYEIARKTVRTDKDGKFYIPKVFRFAFFRYYDGIGVCAYASGYRHQDAYTERVLTENGWKDEETYSYYGKLVEPENLKFPIFDEKIRKLSLTNLKFELVPINKEKEYYKSLCGSKRDEVFWRDTIGSDVDESFREFTINECNRFLEIYPNSKYLPQIHCRIVSSYTCVWSKKLWLKNRDAALKEYQKMVELYSEDNEYVKVAKKCIEATEIYFSNKKLK